jgi:hypothetical protein
MHAKYEFCSLSITHSVLRLNVVYKMVARQKLRHRLDRMQGNTSGGIFCTTSWSAILQLCFVEPASAAYLEKLL